MSMASAEQQELDTLYRTYDRSLYRSDTGDQDDIMRLISGNVGETNAGDLEVDPANFRSGASIHMQEVGGGLRSGKTGFNNDVEGFILGFDTDAGSTKFYIGNATQYLNWTGTSLIIAGAITATSGTIGGFSIGSDYIRDAANSMGLASTVSGSDDVRFWAGDTYANRATADFIVTESGAVTAASMTITGGSITIGANATIDSSGNATFISLSSLNKKAYTNFENSGRFVSTLGGSGANTFGNQGVTMSTGATSTSYSLLQWKIGNVFTNNPTFTATLIMNSAIDGTARAFIGMGTPGVAGTGFTFINNNMIGFLVYNVSSSWWLKSVMNNGNASSEVGNDIVALAQNDVVEVFIKVTSTSVKFYYRINGGTLTLGDTLTTQIPTGSSEDSIEFLTTSGAAASRNISVIMQCAAYEH